MGRRRLRPAHRGRSHRDPHGIASAAGAALALNEVGDRVSGGEAETIGLSGGVALLVILAVAYFCGGYVAGRMARFDGARQGVGLWVVGIVVALLGAALLVTLLAAIAGGGLGRRFHTRVDRVGA